MKQETTDFKAIAALCATHCDQANEKSKEYFSNYEKYDQLKCYEIADFYQEQWESEVSKAHYFSYCADLADDIAETINTLFNLLEKLHDVTDYDFILKVKHIVRENKKC